MELYFVVLASCAGVSVIVGRECIYFPRSFVNWLILRVICCNLIIVIICYNLLYPVTELREDLLGRTEM